jgi:uncharacterized protein (DUF305 family)
MGRLRLITCLIPLAASVALGAHAPAQAQQHDHHLHHQHHDVHGGGHGHTVGPAGATYDLRWIDAMVQHHTGALRMGEFVFDIGQPGVGALAKRIWSDQAQEIRAMGQWRKAWYPQAPVHPVVLRPGGDPNSLAGLQRMDAEQVAAMQMVGSPPSPASRVTWFLEGMIEHHGGALQMAHDALRNSTNPTIQRLARQIIVAQRKEIRDLRSMLRRDGLDKPQYTRFDHLFR